MSDNKYWNLSYILTFNRNFNFINSKRGTGKTYTLMKWLIKEYLKKNKQCIYITRTQDELEDIGLCDPFRKVLENEYPMINFTQVGNDLYLDGQLFCYGVAITQAQKIKKMSYPNVYYIMYDEYMRENAKKLAFVKNEVDEFLSIYSTVDRYEDRVKCFLLGNTTSQFNIFHLHKAFQIPKIDKGKIWTSENVLYQYYDPPQIFEESLEKSKFAKMIADSEYGMYSVKGDFVEDTDTWVEKKTEKATLFFVFIFMEDTFGVWRDINEGKLYVSDKYNPSVNTVYSFTTSDHKENTMLTKASKSTVLKFFTDNYRLGNVRFESIGIKKKAIEAIKLLL